MTARKELVAATKRITAFAELELAIPEREELSCLAGVHFVLVTVDMDGGRGWDCRSSFCGVHAAKMLRAIADALDEREKNTRK